VNAPPRISVVFPAYNEEANVEETMGRARASLARLPGAHEVIVVDDASTDGMPARLEALQREWPALRVVRNPINLGAGGSLLIGMKAATGELVAHDSMVYPFDLDDLERVLPLFPAADVVVVMRTDRSAHSPYRKLTSLVHYWLVRVLFGIPLRDMNFVQVYKRDALARLAVRARSPAFVTPELLIRARDLGMRIEEVPALFHRRRKGAASYGRVRDILWTLADMLSFWAERRRGVSP
jgi:glycosyltransferase involved in cell wall biosynthesis